MEEQDRSEIVIIRRHSAVDAETPKGGVWKIAYADFMTAMMAFFLVMWLINATNEKTRSGVANYFNPIRLSDATAPRKGLKDPDASETETTVEAAAGEKAAGSGAGDGEGDGEQTAGGSSAGVDRRYPEDALFRDPYAVLAEIAAGTGNEVSSQGSGADLRASGSGGSGPAGGEAYRDPFDPIAWKGEPEDLPETIAQTEARVSTTEPAEEAGAASVPAQPDQKAGSAQIQGTSDTADLASASPPPAAPDSAPESSAADTPPASARAEAAKVKSEIGRLLAGGNTSHLPDVDVKGTAEGMLISLTDEAEFGMFAVGSAEPRPEMIMVMEKIAHVLEDRPGTIVIRGHTDGRPFKSETYDNWRLSTARAHMAYYMLVRGGLDEKRVTRIEGHADRDLKIKDDPEAAQNRRIDILIREGAA